VLLGRDEHLVDNTSEPQPIDEQAGLRRIVRDQRPRYRQADLGRDSQLIRLVMGDLVELWSVHPRDVE